MIINVHTSCFTDSLQEIVCKMRNGTCSRPTENFEVNQTGPAQSANDPEGARVLNQRILLKGTVHSKNKCGLIEGFWTLIPLSHLSPPSEN